MAFPDEPRPSSSAAPSEDPATEDDSILNKGMANEEAYFSGDFDVASNSTPFYCSEINFNEISDTLSIASGLSSLSSASKFRRSPKPPVKGSVVRHVHLRQVGAQLQRAFELAEVGSPTAMAVSTLIGIGTSSGATLVFDSEQTLRCKLGSTDGDCGIVSALSFNADATRILVGHSKGHMTMWDTSNGKLLRSLIDVHTPDHGVLLLSFTDDPATAIVGDTGGSVFEVTFKKILASRSYESNCIFSGSRGEVCAMETLRVPRKFRGHPVEGLSLVALGTVTKCIVIFLKPIVTVAFTHQLRADPDTIPVLSWQFSFFQEGTRKVCSPVLAFGRRSTVYLFRVHTHSEQKATFEPLQQLDVGYIMRRICFVNYKSLAILDQCEMLHFLDIRADEEIEAIDCSELEIIYEGSRYRGEDTGGNVSKAMALIGEAACANTISCYGSQCLVLGSRGIHIYSIRSWTDRVNFFSKQKLYAEALRFAISYYNDEADSSNIASNKVMEIVTPKTEKTQALVAEKISLLIEEFALFLVHREGQKVDNLLTHYAANVPLCIHYAVILKNKYEILDSLYEIFSHDPMALTVFLSSLQPYISGGDLPDLNPVIVKDFVNLLNCESKFGELERSLVQLSMTSIDIHQVMTVCKENRLYDAVIHIHNGAMMDYTGPIEEMVDIIATPLAEGREPNYAEMEVGNKLMVYISCCLAGAAYPCGALSPSMATRARESIVDYLTTPVPAGSKRPPFHCLRTLLHFNAREFLNVLSLAFQDEQLQDPNASLDGDGPHNDVVVGSTTSAKIVSTKNFPHNKQKIVDTLLRLMVREEGFETTEMGALFTFLARQMAKQEGSIRVEKQLFEQVVEYLTNAEDESRMEERQQAMLELLTSGGLKDIPVERLLELAEPARFFHVCELLYEKQRRFDRVLLCFLNDPARRPACFSYIQRILQGQADAVRIEEKDQLERQVVEVIDQLIQVDAASTAVLVIETMPARIKEILERLEGMPQTQYQLLEGAFCLAAGDCQETAIAVKDAEIVTTSPEVQEKYIELKCIFNPEGVLTFLKAVEVFRDHEVLAICKSHSVYAATAFLLEKLGDFHEAFESHFHLVDRCVLQWLESLTEHSPPAGFSKLSEQVAKTVYFLQRCSGSLQADEKESMWFRLLDLLMRPQKNSMEQTDIKELTSSLLHAMMGYVSPHAILSKVMSDPVYNMREFREVRRFIAAMIETYNFEQTMLATTNNLLHSDLSAKLADLKRLANRAVSAPVAACVLCGRSFASANTREVIVFRCTHAFHRECVDTNFEAHVAAELKCLRCGRMSSAFGSLDLSSYNKRNFTVGSHSSAETTQVIRRVRLLSTNLLTKDAYRESNFNDVTVSADAVLSTLSPLQMEALEIFKRSQLVTPYSMADEKRSRSSPLLSRDDFKLCLCPIPNTPAAKELFG